MLKIALPVSMSDTQFVINKAYVKYIAEAGFQPVIITPESAPQQGQKPEFDGLLLPGGIDIDPTYYGEDNELSFVVDPEKDEFERNLLHYARANELPIFGICRGFQLIVREYILAKNFDYVEFIQHINDHSQTSKEGLSLKRNITSHFVNFRADKLYGHKKSLSRMPVNSMHHQGVIADFNRDGVIGVGKNGFRMAAWTKKATTSGVDDTFVLCEACRITGWGNEILAVQWHPEELMDIELIRNFFTECCKSKKSDKAKSHAV